MSKVVLIRCESYESADLKPAIARGIELLGGIEQFASKGQKVLLKTNIVVGDPPEKCVTTHPEVLRHVGKLFLQTQAVVSFGDSPAFGSTKSEAKKAGLSKAAEEAGILLADFTQGTETSFPEGKQNKKFVIANAVLESDVLISLPKLKTHGMQKYTGAVKNQFGCIPGVLKAEFHVKLPDANQFAQMLLDLNTLVNPKLYIMDGVWAMEGNGPRGGTPKKMNVLLFSTDPIAMDATICRMINVDPALVPTIKFGAEYGLGKYRTEDIEMVGDDFTQFYDKNFDVDRSTINPYKHREIFKIFNMVLSKPVIKSKLCKKCGMCVNMCPAKPKALQWPDKKQIPTYNYDNCIRCFCCQEICPESAIYVKKSLLRRIFRLK